MKRSQLYTWLVGGAIIMGAQTAWADAVQDLKAGRAAMEAGEFDKALPLLKSAVQLDPKSVEAQQTLGDYYLRTGQVDLALAQFQGVLRLSPDHEYAKRVVAALTGQQAQREQRVALARMLLEAGAHAQAEPLLVRAVAEAASDASRFEARLLLAETRLWLLKTSEAMTDALLIYQETPDAAQKATAQVIAGLSMMQQSNFDAHVAQGAAPSTEFQQAAALLKAGAAAAEPWKGRAALGQLLIDRRTPNQAAAVSAKLLTTLKTLPESKFRQAVSGMLLHELTTAARIHLNQGELEPALAILWPMVSAQPVPGAAAVLKPVDAKGGWVDDVHIQISGAVQTGAGARLMVAQALIDLAQAERQQRADKSTMLGFWLASEVLRQAPHDNRAVEVALNLAAQVATFSKPAPGRQPGEALSETDTLQKAILLAWADRLDNEKLRTTFVDLVIAHLHRYQNASDGPTGLAHWCVVQAANMAVDVQLIPALRALPAGGAQAKLWKELAVALALQGRLDFEKSVALLQPDANQVVNKYDQAALILAGRYAAQYESDPVASGIIERYAGAEHWTAALQASTLFYQPQTGQAGDWALVQLKIRQAQHAEAKLLAGNRKLGEKLPAEIEAALADVVKLLRGQPTKASRQMAQQLGETLVNRYAGLDRLDLSEAVIAALSAAAPAETPAVAKLDDWALWIRASLQERLARIQLTAAQQAAGDEPVKLVPAHVQELKLLGQLITQHRESDYLQPAVSRFTAVSNAYVQHNSFDTALSVLQDFLKAHPKLSVAEQFEYQVLQVTLAKAGAAFSKRENADQPPTQLSPEYAAALNALAAFVKAHPKSSYAPAVEQQLFGVAITYAQQGAWSVSRTVLARFAAAAPEFRSPAQLKLWEAATYLGELDSAYGLSLLQPLATRSASHIDGTELAAAFDAPGKRPELESFEKLAGTLGDLDSPASELSKSKVQLPPGERPTARPQPVVPAGPPAITPAYANNAPGGQPAAEYYKETNEMSLALVRQAQQQQYSRIAMLQDERGRRADPAQGQSGGRGGEGKGEGKGEGRGEESGVMLPTGSLLTEAEMKRQDTAADKAYAILITLAKDESPEVVPLAHAARNHILWLVGFFEGQLRADQAIVYIDRYLKDRPTDAARVALAYQAISDRLTWAGQRQAKDRIDQAWLDKQHLLFEEARSAIEAFMVKYKSNKEWVQRAQLAKVESYDQESQLAAAVSAVRAGGLLTRSADALLALLQSTPDHPECYNFPARLWNLAERLRGLNQQEQAIYVLSQIPIHFPTDNYATQSVLRIGELYAANLSNPLRAVETYQEYISLAGDYEGVRSNIFGIAQQLASAQRYLEALHVYGVFVDSFPSDPRAAEALKAIGQTHQSNEAWTEAIASYERILSEYPQNPVTPQVKLAIAECQINLSGWRSARRMYEEFVAQYPNDGQANLARNRLPILKNLERFQALMADEGVTRNKDDAQFQIARIVEEQLQNRVKAIEEYNKVVKEHPQSDLADDAQLEIGKALLALNRLDDARTALLLVPRRYPNSPVADDALFLVAQSFEQQAHQLASVTVEKARQEAFERNQRGAYMQFNDQIAQQTREQTARRDMLKKENKSKELELDEAQAALLSSAAVCNIGNFATAAEWLAETESTLQVANRQDRINDAYREAAEYYMSAASDYPLGDRTDESLLKVAQIYETQLKDRAAAMQTYLKIVKQFPGTPVAEDAAWKVASFYEQEGKFSSAADAYRDFIRTFPASDRVADAQFALAEMMEQLGKWIDAMDAYETFRQKFGKHPKAQLAMEQINWIKAYRK